MNSVKDLTSLILYYAFLVAAGGVEEEADELDADPCLLLRLVEGIAVEVLGHDAGQPACGEADALAANVARERERVIARISRITVCIMI